MWYVYSTMTGGVNYHDFVKTPDGLHEVKKTVSIRGGANILPKDGLYTPNCCVTEISDEDAEFLEANTHFQEHKKKGFVTLQKVKVDPEQAARDLQENDGSAPRTKKQIEEMKEKVAKKKD